MADNYLENQYEQYQARKAAWEKAKKSGKVQTLHKPTLPLKKGGKKVFVTGGGWCWWTFLYELFESSC